MTKSVMIVDDHPAIRVAIRIKQRIFNYLRIS
ncbi:Uncharacterised protein [Yersinia enterocolitica]|nr:Uncharacterised protein [Yersinia enterocolitica]